MLTLSDGLSDYTKPYFITQRRLESQKVAALEKQLAELRTKTAEKEQKEEEPTGMMALGGRLMIGGPAGFAPPPNGGMQPAMTGFY